MEVLDCIVIGAGPAGLSASLFLARYRRRVVTVHDGRPRNAFARRVHGVLGHDGISPAELLARGRAEVERYGGRIIEAKVTAARRIEGELFEVTLGEGASATMLRGRRLLLATGLCDVLPAVEGFEGFYGRSVHHCPDCDGYEVSGRRVAVLSRGSLAADFALKLLTWTRRVTLLTDGPDELVTPEQRAKLGRHGVAIVERGVAAFEGDVAAGQIRHVRFADGERLECDALFFSLGVTTAGDLYEMLGCDLDKRQLLSVDYKQQTSVPGVYAAGDLIRRSQLVVEAAAEGATAAIQIHQSLLPEDLRE